MANKRISALDSLATPADGDILPITDVSDTITSGSADGTTKGVTVANLHSGLQAEPTEGAFVDGDKTKLDGIEASADVTDATNVTAAGALMDSEVTNLAQVKAFDSTAYATAAHTHAIDDLSDVTITSASNEDVIKFDGTSFVNGQVSVNVDTPLNTALRGTDNPHIGAYPNQSFKVIDNPKKLVMVIATDSGDLDFLLPDGGSIFLNTPTGGRLAPGFGFSVQEDSIEPDIEVASGGENYSVISGDSDTKGASGLPVRQGFNNPDIGANPAPILISGGSIA